MIRIKLFDTWFLQVGFECLSGVRDACFVVIAHVCVCFIHSRKTMMEYERKRKRPAEENPNPNPNPFVFFQVSARDKCIGEMVFEVSLSV